MVIKWSQLVIPDLVQEFKQSAMTYYSACDDENFRKQKVKVKHTNKIIEALDCFGAEGRLALVPLLDDPDQGIRVVAAAFLLKRFPEQAIAALEEVRKGPTYFPRMDAWSFLDSYAKGKWCR
ncbi:DUF2019 domain-containing protein [Rhodoblastus sp. 17X3]|uniref:DUF2019 domain-containing protein n=1 Tax=Rhodoblastus sp. 17X3 TaxID=3047026 RepID=UPI0024B6C55B|nr:DUF2019 domain-containing protein [Rhodoblastus sp. 17X3]MDI9849993.1 DUF2019 domain-containing protein [Rhodoblastus sp. 17X3]